MKKLKILVKFPIRYRAKKFFETYRLYAATASNLGNVHFLVTLDEDDKEMNNEEVIYLLEKLPMCEFYFGNSQTKVEAINADIEKMKVDWDILLLASDDMIPKVQGWDEIIRDKMLTHYPDLSGVLHFNDGFQGELLNTLSIFGRNWYKRFGYIYNPVYRTMWCDNEFTDVSRLLNKVTYFDECIIRHEHAYTGLCEMDELYRKNESAEFDKMTFEKRRVQDYYISNVLIIQEGRVGDILICLPIAKFLADQNILAFWLCPKEYHSLFDGIDYVRPIETRRPTDRVIDLGIGFGGEIEMWWSENKANFDSFVSAKYFLAGVNVRERWNLKWKRNEEKENELRAMFPETYILTHEASHTGKYLDINCEGKVEFIPVAGYSIFDWYKVIQDAQEIICIDSSLSNFIEAVPEFASKKKTIYTDIREEDYFLRSIYKNNWTKINVRTMKENKKRETVIVIPVFKRPAYLLITLDSVLNCLTPEIDVVIIDDCSRSEKVDGIIQDFERKAKKKGSEVIKIVNSFNFGISGSLLRGLDSCSSYKSIITLDSDFQVKAIFVDCLLSLLNKEGDENTIVTGFNASSHPVKEKVNGHLVKATIGGGNLCFTWEAYKKHIRPSLSDNLWDWRMCESIAKYNGRFLCTGKSVAQHIGIESTLGHEKADIADDY